MSWADVNPPPPPMSVVFEPPFSPLSPMGNGLTTRTRPQQLAVSESSQLLASTRRLRMTNPVERTIRMAVYWLRWCCLVWLLGILLVLLKFGEVLWFLSWSGVFLPFWFGNIMILATQIRVLMRAGPCYDKILPVEKYEKLCQSHREVDLSLAQTCITDHDIHLVNRGAVSVLISIPTLLLITVSQSLLCTHLETGGRPPLWACLLPIILIEVVMVANYVLIKTNTWRAGATSFLLFLATIFTAARGSSGGGGEGGGLPWTAALSPLWVLNLLFLHRIIMILAKHAGQRYVLRLEQLVACALYICSVLFTTLGQILLCVRSSVTWGSDVVSGLWIPLATLYLGIFCAAIAIIIVLQLHADWLISTKGFGEPLVLKRNDETGVWEPSGAEQGYELCLGVLDKRAQSISAVRANFRPAISSTQDFELATRHPGSDHYDSGNDSTAYHDLYESTGAESN